MGREQSHSSLRCILRGNKWKATLCLHLCQKQSKWGLFIQMNSHIITNKIALFTGFYCYHDCILLNYSLPFFSTLLLLMIKFLLPCNKAAFLYQSLFIFCLLSPRCEGHNCFSFFSRERERRERGKVLEKEGSPQCLVHHTWSYSCRHCICTWPSQHT